MKLKRVFAYLIDLFIVAILVNLILYIPIFKNTQERYLEASNEYYNSIINSATGSSDFTEEELIKQSYDFQKELQTVNIIMIGVTFLYFGVIGFICNGQTLGKKILKIRIVPAKGNNLNPALFILRTIIICNIATRTIMIIVTNYCGPTTWYAISNVINNIQSILTFIVVGFILFRDDERGLHDLLCNTKVVEN